jgi:hypothetical protein
MHKEFSYRAAYIIVAMKHACDASHNFGFHRSNIWKNIGMKWIGFAE